MHCVIYSRLVCKKPHFSKPNCFIYKISVVILTFPHRVAESGRDLPGLIQQKLTSCRLKFMLYPCAYNSHHPIPYGDSHPLPAAQRDRFNRCCIASALAPIPAQSLRTLDSINQIICHLKLQPTNSPIPTAPKTSL